MSLAEILEGSFGEEHLRYIQEMLDKLYMFLDSSYFETDQLRDAAIDELCEYLKSKKSKPKDNGHA